MTKCDEGEWNVNGGFGNIKLIAHTSCMDPGVSGATWLGIPPGKLNCLNSFPIPVASSLMLG